MQLTSLFRQFRKQANKRGLDCSLDMSELYKLISGECFYCGRFTNESNINGIDRVDSNKGYVTGNCLSCCGICNVMKSKLSLVAFKNHITQIYRYWAHKNDDEKTKQVLLDSINSRSRPRTKTKRNRKRLTKEELLGILERFNH